MINRVLIKQQAQGLFKINRWPCIVVALLLTVALGSSATGGTSSGLSYNVNADWVGDYFSFGTDPIMTIAVGIITLLGLGSVVLIGLLSVARIIFLAPFEVGVNASFYRMTLGQPMDVNTALRLSFGKDYLQNVGKMIIRNLFIFLWTMLFVIPGIVKGYAYAFVPYLLSENPRLTAKQAIALSTRMTQGIKGELFVLDLSFIGWNLASACTLGLVGIFYARPYYLTTYPLYYKQIREMALSQGRVQRWELGLGPANN